MIFALRIYHEIKREISIANLISPPFCSFKLSSYVLLWFAMFCCVFAMFCDVLLHVFRRSHKPLRLGVRCDATCETVERHLQAKSGEVRSQFEVAFEGRVALACSLVSGRVPL